MSEPMVFQVCDEVRQEEHRKMSLMGIYHRNEVLLLKGDVPTVLAKLFFYLLLEVKKKTTGSSIEIVGPNGVITHLNKGRQELLPGKKNVVAVGIYQFQIPMLGQYELILRGRTGKEIFKGTFKISSQKAKRKKKVAKATKKKGKKTTKKKTTKKKTASSRKRKI